MAAPRRTKKKLNAVTRENTDGTISVHPVHPRDTAEIASALLAVADPSEVRTITGPAGWVTSPKVAKAAGLV